MLIFNWKILKGRYLVSLRRNEAGITIVENLVAIALIGIVLVGAVPLVANCFNTNAAARSFTAVTSDVQQILDGYRSSPYSTLLGYFGSSPGAIANGQVATITTTSGPAHASYTVQLTAIRAASSSLPEAVKISIAIAHRQGKIGTRNFTYETVISQTS